jgi:hypothetical protein
MPTPNRRHIHMEYTDIGPIEINDKQQILKEKSCLL